jgi:adenylosuccinate synthase
VAGTCVIGLQWGDEAKGKLVDLLTSRFDVVVRYQGGANAGHTVVVGDKTYKLHHIPSGILNANVMNVVTPGVVINPPTILQELDSLASQGVRVAENLMLSDRAHVVFPWHIAEDRLRFVTDTTAYLLDEVEAGKKMLFEGAQGSLLDIDHGTFPYVTSSNASGVGVSAGSGVPGKWITKIIGVCKAYTTRVGGGPFPTEQNNEMGNKIRELGREYGTTTGRPRRCGWFDAVAVRYTSRLSGVDAISLMMMDVLSLLPEIKICTEYEIDGQRTKQFPSHVDDLRKVVPIYETIPGWQTDVTKVRKIADLPLGARQYIDRIAELVGKPVEVVSVGPDRAQTMFAGSLVI